MQVLRETLGEHCGEEDTLQFTEKLAVLKAVGNAGLAAAPITPVLSACAQNHSSPLELRLAAIHAFRRIPCSADRRPLLQLYRSGQEDVEVRIAAYLQLMRCPDPEVLRRVRATLSTETSSQVGTFVWSHLTQIQKTEDPLKQALMELLPDDIISKDFEAESWKYSSYMDTTVDTGFGGANLEGALVFSPSSFVPRSAMANLTLHVLGRAFNLLEINIRAENMEPLLKEAFGHKAPRSDEESSPRNPTEDSVREKRSREEGEEDNGLPGRKGKGGCRNSSSSRLRQAKAKFAGRQSGEGKLRCGLSVKLFGNELAFVTCDDVSAQMRQLSLSLAGVAVRLLKGQEVQFNRRAVLATEELVLPSLSGLPIKLALNMSSSLSVRVKGSVNFINWSHFSIGGYIKPSAYLGVVARVGVEGPCGLAGVEWTMGLRTSTSLDGGIQLQKGQDLKVALNTPEDIMDIIHFSSRTYSISGEIREELSGSRDRLEKTVCTPQDWSKMLGWQLCSQASYPLSRDGVALPPPGPVLLSLRMLKLDRGLHQYLLEAAYTFQPQGGSWIPLEASLHLFLGTPQSTVPRDVALDLSFNLVTQRFALKVTHPLKSIHIQGQADQVRNMRSGKVELVVDNIHRYYIRGLMNLQTLPTEQRLVSHVVAKVTTDGRPIILSANVTRGLGRKIRVSAKLKNLFRDTATFSVLLERMVMEEQRQYTAEAEVLLPGLLGSEIFGMLLHSGPLWGSVVRLRYGLRGAAQQECHMTQTLKSERDPSQTYHLRVEHELSCSHTTSFNHKFQLKHEEGPSHIQSTLDLSYGKHWDEINNKRRVLLSQTFKNQSRHALTSYLLEFSLQFLEKHLNYKTQLLHSHLRHKGAESSTHLKVNYNDQMPLVAGLHWKDSSKALLRRWEGSFNMDTPWLYVYSAHKLSQPQRRAVQFSAEITTRKWVTLRNLVLEGSYREKSKEREGRLHLYTPTTTYLKASGWGLVGKRGLKASSSLSSAWTPSLRGDLSLENSRHRKALQLAASFGKQNLSLSTALSSTDKKLRKRLVTVKVVLTEPKSPAVELELEGCVEELKRDRDQYQKQGRLHFRQPFRHLPQSLLLQETFTVDLQRALYILESRALLNGDKESIHTLSLGYQPTGPFVCSALVHPFSSDTIPQDSELCVTVHRNQTQQEIKGTVRIDKREKLIVVGRVQNTSDSSERGLVLQLNLTHLLQLQLPPSVSLEGKLLWRPRNGQEFDYMAAGKALINHQEECQFTVQLNGSAKGVELYSSFSQPFNSRIPKTFQVRARGEVSGEGGVSSSLSVRTDNEDRATLEADLVNTLQNSTRVLGARLALRQRLLPVLQDTELQLSTNVSTDRLSALCALRQGGGGSLKAQLGGALEYKPGLRVAVSGALQNSLPSLKVLPATLGLEGALTQSQKLTEGELKVTTREAVYGLELSHREGPGGSWESAAAGPAEEGTPGGEADWTRDTLCVRASEQYLCVNVTGGLAGPGGGGLHTLLSHSSPALRAAGLPSNSSMRISWTRGEHKVSAAAELQAGGQGLKAELEGSRSGQVPPRWELLSSLQHHSELLLERGVPSSMDAVGHYQVETGGVSVGAAVRVEERSVVEVLMEAGRTNDSAKLAASMKHHVEQLTGLIPSAFQMNCTGEAAADRVSGQCSGSVSGEPAEVRAFHSRRPHKRCQGAELRYGRSAARLEACRSTKNQTELTASASHSFALLSSLGVPTEARVRAFLKPRLHRWLAVLGASLGEWRAYVSGQLTVAPVYRWHGLASYSAPSSSRTAEVRGLVRTGPCYFVADVSAALDGATSSLVVSARCGGLRVTWVQLREGEGGGRTSLTVLGQAGRNGVRGSLGLEKDEDSLHCQASLLLLEKRADVGWTLQHRWASLTGTVPDQLDLHGSVRAGHASVSGSARLSLGPGAAQLQLSAAWEPHTFVRAALQHGLPQLRDAGIPEDSSLSLSLGRGRARMELSSESCSVSAHGSLTSGRSGTWSLAILQSCTWLQMLLPEQFAVNGSMVSSGCGTHLEMRVESRGEERGALSLAVSCSPELSLRASVRHSLPPLRALGVPPRSMLALSALPASRPAAQMDLVLGQCELRASVGAHGTSASDEARSGWAANFTNRCPPLLGAGLPESLALSALLSLTPCRSAVSCSVSVEGEGLSLNLGRSCDPTNSLSGVLTHSFARLRERGLPHETSLTLAAPGSPGQSGEIVLRAGPCRIRASGDMRPGRRSQWVWVTETECPLLEDLSLPAQSQFNGSLLLDGCVVEATADARLAGRWASLRLTAGCRPGLRVEAQRRREAGLELQLDRCSLRASAGLQARGKLQGTLLLHNNCTVLQDMGTPSRMEGSGFLVIENELLDTHLSLVTDESKLQALLTLKAARSQQEALAQLTHSVPLLLRGGVPANATLSVSSERGPDTYHRVLSCSMDNQQVSEMVSVERTQGEVRVQYLLNHTLDSLRDLGLPENNSIQGKLTFGEMRSLTLHSQLGARLAGLEAQLRDTPAGTEVAGTLQHSWHWLQERGLPRAVEAMCTVQGVFPQLQSRVNLTVDGEKLLVSTLNISVARERLALLLSLTSSPLLAVVFPQSLDTALTAHDRGVQKHVSVDVHCDRRRVRVAGEVGGWGTGGREVRAALQDTVEGEDVPKLQVEAWGRLTDSHLRGSLALNPETNSSLAFTVLGHSLPSSKELNVKLLQNIPVLQLYLPSQLQTKTQLNQSSSAVQGMAELRLDGEELRALGELALTKAGYSQALRLDHSFSQLKSLPKNVEVRMTYDQGNQTRRLQQHILWGGQDLRVSGQYTTPPDQDRGAKRLQVQMSSAFASLPHECSLDVQLERSAQRRLDSLLLGWTGHRSGEQVRALCFWSSEEDRWEGRVDLRQTFTPPLSHLHLHTLSYQPAGGQGNSHQAQLSWNDGIPLNVTLRVKKHWHTDSSRGHACISFAPGQLKTVLPLVEIQGCGSMAREGNSYSQNAELNWGNKRITQGMKYQRGARGLHTLQLEGEAENVSPSPCPSHTLLLQIHTNCRDQLEHHLQLGLCPPHPSWDISGYHRVNTGKELFYTQTRLSVSGQPQHSSLTLALTNSSTPQRTNFSLRTEARVHALGLQIRNKLLARIQTLHKLLMEFRHQSRDSMFLQELSARPLRLTQRAEALLVQSLGEAWGSWKKGSLRHALTDTLPRCLGALQHVSQQLQQELKRPLATLAGVYQDVTGRRLDVDWRETAALWAGKLVELLPAELEDHHLRAPLKAALRTLTTVLDVVGHQTAQWAEAKLAAALSGIRRRLASLYRLSHSRCEVTVQVPLPRGPWSEIGGAGLTEFLLEEWLLRPLQALATLSPTAEMYRLKRRLMDSPFRHQALLVSDQFAVSFDGRLYELPGRCALLLAHDAAHDSFTVLLSPDTMPQRTLLVEMGNTTVSISPEGQVETNCHVADMPLSHNGVTVKKESNLIEVSNKDGVLVSCDLSQAVCSLTLDGWQHGVSAGLLGTNDNEAGNELVLPDGSQSDSLSHFIHSWQVRPQCRSDPGRSGLCSNTTRPNPAADSPTCGSLFSSPDSPLSSCFRVVDPTQFLSVCKRSHCVPTTAPCRLAAAFVHLCRRNYIPLELPQQCASE
ncbi:hypothetical protein MATL_G00240760 [Megalops atlanticus]|uniref:VWFD domain-containing protein n=1 Tax=Megalops atlanticus TaxID=7932 RepID=A0A9D3T1A2_MEGAT|nr:hypothetical protein MATL_G00240760 [Megalops atlanticus]